MHEYSIVQALLDQAESEGRARGAISIRRLRLRVGVLSGVDPDLLETAYRTFRAGSLCSEAELDIVPVEAVWKCSGCGRGVATGGWLRCPVCDRPARLAQGDELVLERLEMEVPDV